MAPRRASRATPPPPPPPVPASASRPRLDQTLPGVGRRDVGAGQGLRAKVLVTPLDHEQGPFWAAAEEISHRGMFIRTRQMPREDALLMIELVFPELTVPKLRLDAHVVHRIPGAGFGCSFVAVPEKVTRRLSELVAHTAAAPQRTCP